VGQEARTIRATLLELERLHNHVADLGAIVNDVGFGIVHAHAQRIRERLLRHHEHLTGHRLLRGGITVGGARLRAAPDLDLLDSVAAEVAELVDISLDHGTVRDRLTGTAVLSQDSARQLDVLGYVARASGVDSDARRDHPFLDAPESWAPVLHETGDVLARFRVRAEEVAVSVAMVRELTGALGSALTDAAPVVPAPGSGAGVVEAWRGTLVTRVDLDESGSLARVKVVDPSFFNWPALPVALADTIVPDFPLANKSFNQSYAGNDL
jgi:Ni,Fe-hydrogenase III large subunit